MPTVFPRDSRKPSRALVREATLTRPLSVELSDDACGLPHLQTSASCQNLGVSLSVRGIRYLHRQLPLVYMHRHLRCEDSSPGALLEKSIVEADRRQRRRWATAAVRARDAVPTSRAPDPSGGPSTTFGPLLDSSTMGVGRRPMVATARNRLLTTASSQRLGRFAVSTADQREAVA